VACGEEVTAQLAEGDSIAVNGVCLTAVRIKPARFEADLLPATLAHTSIGNLPLHSTLNLEPALRAGQPLGGHIVQGHVDGTTKLLLREDQASGTVTLSFALPSWLGDWIVPKGSICVDGVSLTVQDLGADSFTVQLIPETLARTNLGSLQAGQRVNLEADLIVKTISQLMRATGAKATPPTN